MRAEGSGSLRIGILASGGGTGCEELLSVAASGSVNAEIALILTDRAQAPVLARAERYRLPAKFLDPKGLARKLYDQAVSSALTDAGVDLVLMAGYMRIVSSEFIEAWRGRLLNVHPSLLPAFAGLMDLRVHEAVLASGVTETGCTVHHVTEQVDAGVIVLQKRCTVMPDDTPESLRERVQALENEAFVEVVRRWFQSETSAEARERSVVVEQSLMGTDTQDPLVGIIMGSRSDWPTMEAAAQVLDELGVAYEAEVISAHRTPEKMVAYAQAARDRGLRVIVAGAGGAAHLPGMLAALTPLPVLGVPVQSKALNGLDSLLSIVQMPGGVPVATFAIGAAGARNAGLFAAAILALQNSGLAHRLDLFRQRQTDAVLASPDPREPEPAA